MKKVFIHSIVSVLMAASCAFATAPPRKLDLAVTNNTQQVLYLRTKWGGVCKHCRVPYTTRVLRSGEEHDSDITKPDDFGNDYFLFQLASNPNGDGDQDNWVWLSVDYNTYAQSQPLINPGDHHGLRATTQLWPVGTNHYQFKVSITPDNTSK
jgi:hypothetical protein